MKVLSQTYSLSSDVPSAFALDIVARLKMSEACLMLLETRNFFSQFAPSETPPGLRVAIEAAGCEQVENRGHL